MIPWGPDFESECWRHSQQQQQQQRLEDRTRPVQQPPQRLLQDTKKKIPQSMHTPTSGSYKLRWPEEPQTNTRAWCQLGRWHWGPTWNQRCTGTLISGCSTHCKHPARPCTKQTEQQSRPTGNKHCTTHHMLKYSKGIAKKTEEEEHRGTCLLRTRMNAAEGPKKNSEAQKTAQKEGPTHTTRTPATILPTPSQFPTINSPNTPFASSSEVSDTPKTQTTTRTEGHSNRDGDPASRACRDRDHREDHSSPPD